MTRDGPGDVRMRGFRDRAPVEAFQEWVDRLEAVLPCEEVGLEAASGRVLAEDLVSDVDVPAFARAAMDGWAVRGEDTFGASETDPLTLAVVGIALPGRGHPGRLGRGEVVRIMTGAPVPDGADAVLPAEEGAEEDGSLAVRGSVPPRRHVGAAGEDVRAGTRLLSAGRRLRPQDVGLAASVGRGRLAVRARPRVAVLATGDELLAPGEAPRGERIVDSNSPMLRALVERDGGVVAGSRRLGDARDALAKALHEADADLVLVSGGSSVGQEDHAPRILAEDGELAFHGMALRPASPAGGGRLGGRPVFLLPGNPVSCLCAYDLFAGRLVRRLAGRPPDLPYRVVRVRLARRITSALGREDYVRVLLGENGAEPVMSRGASILSSTTRADGFVLVPRDLEGHAEGRDVDVYRYEG